MSFFRNKMDDKFNPFLLVCKCTHFSSPFSSKKSTSWVYIYPTWGAFFSSWVFFFFFNYLTNMIGWLCCFLVPFRIWTFPRRRRRSAEGEREREREKEREAGRAVHEEEGNGCVDLTPKVPLPSMMEKQRGKTTTRTTSKDQQVPPLLKGDVAGKCQWKIDLECEFFFFFFFFCFCWFSASKCWVTIVGRRTGSLMPTAWR